MHPCIVGLDKTEGTTNLEKKNFIFYFHSKHTFCPDIRDFETLVELVELLRIRLIKFTHVNFLYLLNGPLAFGKKLGKTALFVGKLGWVFEI